MEWERGWCSQRNPRPQKAIGASLARALARNFGESLGVPIYFRVSFLDPQRKLGQTTNVLPDLISEDEDHRLSRPSTTCSRGS